MDSEKALINKSSILGSITAFSTFPVIGMVFVMIASSAFYVSRTHDEQVWLSLYDIYSPFLLKKEKSFYLDFYSKRLAIEKQGSQAQLKLISDTIQAKDNKQLTRLILSDRGFRTYLIQKAPIYFTPEDKEHWFSDNQTLMKQLYRLTSYQFSVIPEVFISSPSVSKLFTYIFVDEHLESLIINSLIFLLLSAILERFIKRKVFVAIIITASMALSCQYIFIAGSFSPPLKTFNGLNYFLLISLFSAFIRAEYSTKFSKSWPLLFIGTLILSGKITFDYYSNAFSKEFVLCLIPLCVGALVFGWFHKKFHLQKFSLENQVTTISRDDFDALTQESRHKYAEALSALSRFNFHYSRQVMRLLRKEHPESLQIVESAYQLEKLCPDGADFWALAENRIEHCLVSQNYPEMLSLFQDLQKAAPSRQSAGKNISPNHYSKILVVFLQHGDIEKAEHAFMFLELAGKPVLVKEACKLLIDAFSKRHNSKKTEHYQALFDSYLETN